jgi:aminoglycoside phosphotransferase (APT) family kinase protein
MTTIPGIDLAALRARLSGPLDCAPDDLTVEMIDGGRSNLTYRISDGPRCWVLRRPPLGHVLATAHDMGREYRVMSALQATSIPVPQMVLAEADPTIIGAPFFVMEFVEGPVVRDAADAARLSVADAARAGNDLVDHLVRLHQLDVALVGLGDLGRPHGFMRRQIRRWLDQWEQSADPVADAGIPVAGLAAALAAVVPESSGASLLHGDYRLDNTILSAQDPGRIAAIIDWEMATLGDPLADLGLLLTYWTPVAARVTGTAHAVSANQGFPSTAQLIDRYQVGSGASLVNLAFYVAFGHFKLAVIAQTINARYRQGLTVGPEFESAGEAIPYLVQVGLDTVARADPMAPTPSRQP